MFQSFDPGMNVRVLQFALPALSFQNLTDFLHFFFHDTYDFTDILRYWIIL